MFYSIFDTNLLTIVHRALINNASELLIKTSSGDELIKRQQDKGEIHR